MAPRTRQKREARPGRKVNENKKLKKLKLKAILEGFDFQVEKRVQDIETDCANACEKIEQAYAAALSQIPEEFHSKTIKEIREMCALQEANLKASATVSPASSFMNKYELCRSEKKLMMSQRKKLQPSVTKGIEKNKLSTCGSIFKNNRFIGLTGTSHKPMASVQQAGTPLSHKFSFMDKSRTIGLKGSVWNNRTIITPKFDPRTPLPNKLLRKPRAGEVIVSMSGSPLRNMQSISEKPGVLLSLGAGKVLDVTDPSVLKTFDLKDIDNEVRINLRAVYQNLAKILH